MRNIISYLVLAAIILFIGYAYAATSFNFAAATDGTYIFELATGVMLAEWWMVTHP